MQHLQPNTTLQGGKYRIERVLGQVDFSRVFIFSLLIMFPVLMMAQASGGQIRRKVSATSKTNSVKRETKKENRTDKTIPLIQPTPISGFSTYNVVVCTMGIIANASRFCQSLRDQGYSSLIYQDDRPEMTLYRITIGSTNNEQEALRIRDQARNTYPDAWILYFVNGKQERYW